MSRRWRTRIAVSRGRVRAVAAMVVVSGCVTAGLLAAPRASAEPLTLPGQDGAAVAYTTPAGTAAFRYYVWAGTPTDDHHYAQVLLPADFDPLAPTPTVLVSHGATATEDNILTTAGAKVMADAWLDRGWAVIATRSGSEIRFTKAGLKRGRFGTWGNQASSAGIADAWDWARTAWNPDPHGLLLYGWSMGGVSVVNAAAELRRRGEPVGAVAMVDGVTNLRYMYQRSPSAARALRRAYALPRGTTVGDPVWVANVDVADGGHEPLFMMPAQAADGYPLRMSASAGDPTVTASTNSFGLHQILRDSWTAEIGLVVTTGGHAAKSHFDPTDTNAFFERALTRNLAPTSVPTVVANVDGSVTLSAGASHDPDGTIVDWQWDLGDGVVTSGAEVVHRYDADGSYTVTLTVTDDRGATASASVAVMVDLDDPPTAAATAVVGNLAVALDGTASSDPDGVVVEWRWDLGDGTTALGPVIAHDYAVAGSYVVTLTVVDDAGNADETSLAIEAVAGAAPLAAFDVSTEGLTLHADGSPSSDPDGVVAAWSWDFGDGTTAEGPLVDHGFAVGGSYVVTLTVVDDDGAAATTSRVVAVAAPLE